MSFDAEMEIENEEEESESGNSALRKKLRDAQKQARDAEERAVANEAAAKRLAFMDAGLPDNPQATFFREHYQGDLTADAIRTAAQANGFMAAQEAETQAEVAQIDSMGQVVQGAESPEQAGSMEAMEREMREAAEQAFNEKGPDAVGPAIAAVQSRYNRPTTLDSV